MDREVVSKGRRTRLVNQLLLVQGGRRRWRRGLARPVYKTADKKCQAKNRNKPANGKACSERRRGIVGEPNQHREPQTGAYQDKSPPAGPPQAFAGRTLRIDRTWPWLD